MESGFCPRRVLGGCGREPLYRRWLPGRLPADFRRSVNSSDLARPAGSEPATRCLEGTAGGLRDVAWRRSTSHLAALIAADHRRTSPGICLHWLTYWLPKI